MSIGEPMETEHTVLPGFYVLEGIDGSGTTTQLNNLKRLADDTGIQVHVTCEPTVSPIGKTIRRILKGDYPVSQESMARLFSADRCDHLDNADHGIKKYLSDGIKVISDRYLFSSLVYQSLGFPLDAVKALNNFPLPEVLFFIDIPPDVGIQRRNGRSIEEIYERHHLQQSIYERYHEVLSAYADSGMRTERIDGTKPMEEISDMIWRTIANMPKNKR